MTAQPQRNEQVVSILDALGLSLASKRREAMAERAACGIYAIKNTANGKMYIGSAVNFTARFSYHRWQLRKHTHHSQKLQRAWLKHGENAFVFEPLVICSQDNLLMYEQIILDATDAAKHGYNILPTAGSRFGMKHSKETKAKLSAAHTGKVMSPEARLKMSQRMTGYVPSPETRAKISASSMGRKASPEAKEKMRTRFISDEVKEKISNTLMGHSVSVESRAKMAASQIKLQQEKRQAKQKMAVA